nr:MAG TPA: hypothetical protein [Bacteriophage sp.]
MMFLAIIMVAVIMGAIIAFGCLIQGNDYNKEE